MLIHEGNGSNTLVKTERGKKFKGMSLPEVPVDNAAPPTLNPPPLQEPHNLFFQYDEKDNNDVKIGWRMEDVEGLETSDMIIVKICL